MKKLSFLILFFISIFIFTECGKYEEGPTMSFRSRQKRIEGLWKVDKFSVDGTDSTSFYAGFSGSTIDITDGIWEMPMDGGGTRFMGGEWSWHNLKYYIQFDVNYAYINNIYFQTDTFSIQSIGPFATNTSIKWEINRIANKELILSTRHNDMIYRMEMSLQKDHD